MNGHKFSKYIKTTLIITGLILGLAALFFIDENNTSAQSRIKPISKAAMIEAAAASIKYKIGTSELVRMVRKKGVDFRVTAQVESELRGARLRDEVISAARENYRGASTPPAATTRTTTTASANMPRNTVGTGTGRTSASNTNSEPAEENTDDVDAKYEALYNQALTTSFQLFNQGVDQQRGLAIIQNARNLATQAIKLDKTRPEGYKIFAFTAFIAQNFSEAEKYCQEVIDRGGSVQFDIIHFHGQQPVKEVLYIDDESVSIEYEGGYNVFKYSEILSAQTKGTIPFGQMPAVAVFSMNVNRNNSAFETFFIPALRGTTQDAQLITKIINNNLAKNR